MAAYQVLLLNTAVPQIQAAQAGDTYVVPRDIAFSAALTLSAGTANGVPYLNASKVLTTGSALTFDGTNLVTTGTASATKLIPTGNVTTGNGMYLPTTNQLAWSVNSAEQMRLTSTGLGIGTSSISDRLTVAGNVTIPSNNFYKMGTGNYLYSDGANTVELAAGTSGKLSFVTNGALRATLDASGNLGLGVTPSAWASLYKSFDVAKASSHYGFWDGTTSIAGLANGAFVNSSYSWAYAISGQAIARYAQEGDGAHKWLTAPSGTAGNAITFTQAMTLDASGNLLVGTTSPAYSAAGRGLVEVNGSSTALIAVKTADTARGYFAASTTITELAATGASQPLVFTVNSAERARIKSTGQFRFVPLAADPSGAEAGDVYYNSGTNKLRLYDGSTWVDLN